MEIKFSDGQLLQNSASMKQQLLCESKNLDIVKKGPIWVFIQVNFQAS